MANRSGKKGKKPLQTTLGKATCHNEKDVDLSHIQKPINTSIFGLRQVLSLFQTATKEVQNYVTHECDIMYECRTCRTIFRSLANFILHKRNYCRERFNPIDSLSPNEDIQEACSDDPGNVVSEEITVSSPDKNEALSTGGKRSLLPVIEKLKERQEICRLAQDVLNEDLSSKEVAEDSTKLEGVHKNDVLLEEIATNNAAVFQTVLRDLPKRNVKESEFMKSEVMEIHGILDSDEAVLGPDGKICTFETNKINKNPIIPKNDLFCTECNLKFSTKKTLTYHIKYKHNNTRVVYVCPDCKDTFANAWCVYRHLFKIHRRTSAQIKRMRDQIHNNAIRKDQEPVKKKDKKNNEKIDEENQWLNNIEGDNDFQMCGGCGKRFERKAALNSHAQMCTKRIAVCNTIKENNAKKKDEEVGKDPKNKVPKMNKPEVLKGSSKRKPYLLRTYRPSEEESQNHKDVLHSEENDECDVNANCEIVETNCDTNKAEEELTCKIRSSISSSEDLSSPSKQDFVASPSIEKIDTEKMLHIIGITANSNNSSNGTKSLDNSENPNCEKDVTGEKNRSHTATDFDLFCQSVADSLLISPHQGSSTEESSPQKPSKTVPLILRRKNNSSKCEKKNSILQQNNGTNNKPKTDEKSQEKLENIAQIKEIIEEENSSQTTNFKISVKSLEDLIGVSPQNHVKESQNREKSASPENKSPVVNSDLTELNVSIPKSPPCDISDTLRANVSPEKLRQMYPKRLKRKRTSSFDFTTCDKFSKISKVNSIPNKQDISFVSRASPYMDQNKLLCIPCHTTYPTLSKLLWHMSAHFSWFRFQCSRCSFISFNKLDCANHAKKNHGVRKASMDSVVLPIPNWKTVLMSHEFCMLDDENDLSGKHTDEILSGDMEDACVEEDPIEIIKDNECDETEWDDRLFADSKSENCDPENDPLKPDNPTKYVTNVKQESIDVDDDDADSFQIEVPEEIYTLDISEIIGVNYEERCNSGMLVKIEDLDDDEDINHILTHQDQQPSIDAVKIKEEILDEDTNEKVFDHTNDDIHNSDDHMCPNKQPEQMVNIRPTRNRTRSIKTLQDDFFYDLSKVIKLNDTSLQKSNLQRHKKSLPQRTSKDSTSSSGKIENQQLRVYSKKK